MTELDESTILQAARRGLEVLRARQDGLDARVVRLPGEAQTELARIVARHARKTVRSARVIQTADADDLYYLEGVWELVAARGVAVLMVHLLPYENWVPSGTSPSGGIRIRSLSVSSLPDELSLGARQTWLVDECVVITESAGTSGRSGEWVVSSRPEDVAAASRLMDQIESIDAPRSGVALEEPLALSADLINGVAGVLCRGDHVSVQGCDWYHGSWQYLRLLNLVSTPTWHSSFYASETASALASGGNALITGTADYSVLAYVLAAALTTNAKTAVLDLCPTPLFACSWYARRLGASVDCIQADVFSRPASLLGSADLVVTDAFLTRFSSDATEDVLDLWADYAKPGGRLVTTIRVHSANPVGRTHAEAVEDFVERAVSRYRRWEPYLDKTPGEIATLARTYGNLMISNELGDEGSIRGLFEDHPRWSVRSWERAPVPGELFPTSYVRLVCERVEKS